MKSLFFVAALASFAAATNEEGIAYLKAKEAEDGVVKRPSGLMYKVLKKGSGTVHPKPDTPCAVHYEGTLPDGSVFDSSYKRGEPTTFAPNQVIKGWTEALQFMVEGDQIEVYIPSDLAYGESGTGGIPGGSALTFKMELVEVKGEGTPALTCDATSGDKCNEEERTFIDKAKQWPTEKLHGEIARLAKVASKKMQAAKAGWVNRRRHILEQFREVARRATHKTTEEEEL